MIVSLSNFRQFDRLKFDKKTFTSINCNQLSKTQNVPVIGDPCENCVALMFSCCPTRLVASVLRSKTLRHPRADCPLPKINAQRSFVV